MTKTSTGISFFAPHPPRSFITLPHLHPDLLWGGDGIAYCQNPLITIQFLYNKPHAKFSALKCSMQLEYQNIYLECWVQNNFGE